MSKPAPLGASISVRTSGCPFGVKFEIVTVTAGAGKSWAAVDENWRSVRTVRAVAPMNLMLY
jgi:hypothetical protein